MLMVAHVYQMNGFRPVVLQPARMKACSVEFYFCLEYKTNSDIDAHSKLIRAGFLRQVSLFDLTDMYVQGSHMDSLIQEYSNSCP